MEYRHEELIPVLQRTLQKRSNKKTNNIQVSEASNGFKLELSSKTTDGVALSENDKDTTRHRIKYQPDGKTC